MSKKKVKPPAGMVNVTYGGTRVDEFGIDLPEGEAEQLVREGWTAIEMLRLAELPQGEELQLGE